MFNRTKSNGKMDAWVQEHLSEYLDGTLSPQDRARVEQNLATSPAARQELEDLRWTVSLLRQTPAPPLPRQFTLPVTQRAPQAVPAWMVWGLRGVGVAAVLAFVVLLGLNLMRLPSNGGETAMSLPAQAPAAAQPTARVALQPSPMATFGAPPSANKSFGAEQTPIMITVEPPPATTQVQPITETPRPRASNPPPTSAPAADQSAPKQPPQPTNAPFMAQEAVPSETPAIAAASAAGGAAPESNPNAAPTGGAGAQSKLQSIPSVHGIVLPTQLKVRRGPGTEFPAIGGLNRGDSVTVIARTANDFWLLVQFDQNHRTAEGWVAHQYVLLDGLTDSLPVVLPGSVLPTPLPTDIVPTEVPTPTFTPTPESNDQEEGVTPTPEPPTPIPSDTPVGEQQPTPEAQVLNATAVPVNGQPPATKTPPTPISSVPQSTPPSR